MPAKMLSWLGKILGLEGEMGRFACRPSELLLVSHRMELRCVIAVIRHGDRTPKQKMKMEVKHGR